MPPSVLNVGAAAGAAVPKTTDDGGGGAPSFVASPPLMNEKAVDCVENGSPAGLRRGESAGDMDVGDMNSLK